MTYLAKPKIHHPSLPKNALGYTHRDYEGAISTLCAGCGHDSISAAIIQAFFELDVRAAPGRQAVGHRLLVEDADLFPRQLARFQQRARPHAVGADRRRARQPRPDLPRRLRRRRLGVDRHRASSRTCLRRGVNMVYIVENNGVYGLTKGQFSATADKGSKSKRGAINSDEPIDLAMLALTLGRDVRRARLLRRQGAAGPADQGGRRAPRRGVHRHRQPVRRVQQPSRLDQELRLRARAQRRGQPPRLHLVARRDHDELRAGRDAQRRAARRRHDPPAQARRRLRSRRPRRGDGLPRSAARGGRGRHRPAVPARGQRRTCTTRWTRSRCRSMR